MNSDFLSIVALGIMATLIIITLKQQSKEFALIVSLIASILIFFFIVEKAQGVFSFAENLLKLTKIPSDSFALLLKVLGLAYLTQFSSDLCKDAGETALASKLEIAGKITILLLSIPIFEKIIKMIINVMG